MGRLHRAVGAVGMVFQMQLAQARHFSKRIILRRIADQRPGIGNIQTLEPIIAQAVQDCKRHMLGVNAPLQKLGQIAL